MNKTNNCKKIIVVGNEKGGAGKTTLSMHLIAGLLDKGYKVASIDADSRQLSLTSYVNNRKNYILNHPDESLDLPLHFHLEDNPELKGDDKFEKEEWQFNQVISQAQNYADYIVIDTPGSATELSKLVHSYADLIVTPINDSFIDLDVMAKFKGKELDFDRPSIYSQMVWEQKINRLSRDGASIEWVVLRNRLSNLDALNKRKVSEALAMLAKKFSFKAADGFSERVIYRELFPLGLTLLDLGKVNYGKKFSPSHVAARQELRGLLSLLKIEEPIKLEEV